MRFTCNFDGVVWDEKLYCGISVAWSDGAIAVVCIVV